MFDNNSPLKGISVVDISRILAGPSCTQLLGDYGADIIKVERPLKGDDTRYWGPPFLKNKEGNDSPESSYYLSAKKWTPKIGQSLKCNLCLKIMLLQAALWLQNKPGQASYLKSGAFVQHYRN